MNHKNHGRKIILTLSCLLGLFVIFNLINFSDISSDVNSIEETMPENKIYTQGVLGYTINISDSDPNKNWTEINSLYTWCTGSGTPSDPYVIQDVIIDANGQTGILIENSNRSYFRIENCTVYNSGAGPDAAIKFVNTRNGTMIGNNFSANSGYGIYLSNYCYNNTIMQNNASNNQIGIYLNNECQNNTIANNTVNDNTIDGIFLLTNCGNNTINLNDVINNGQYGIHLNTNCDNNTVSSNLAVNVGTTNCDDGIRLSGNCDNNSILYNNASKTFHYGIQFLSNSKNNTISHNLFHENPDYGVNLESGCDGNLFFNNSFIDNTFGNGWDQASFNRWDNGSLGNYWDDYGIPPINGYDNDDDGIGDIPYTEIDGSNTYDDNYPIWDDGHNGTAIHVNDTNWNNWVWWKTRTWMKGEGTFSNPYLIKDLVINANDTSSGILIENSSVYFRIENCTAYNSSGNPAAGIKLVGISNGTLINNNCSNNNGFGIYLLSNCINLSISGNICNNNSLSGIRLYYNCGNNSISENICYNNSGFGIDLWNNCDFNNISNNIANFSLSASGIYLYSNCDNNTLKGNNCYNNTAYGIHLNTNCNNNSIIENNCNNNSGPGIRIINKCDDNTIQNNTIKNNLYMGILLYSDCNNNTLSNNTISNNLEAGIRIHTLCDNNTVFDNVISFNSISGLDLYNSSKGNTISYNNIFNNSDYSIRINDTCDFNLVYMNILYNSSIQAQDNGTANKWDNGTEGNYWGDYKEKYPNAIYNGFIWLTPYTTDGTASSQDNFPLGEVIINYTGTGNVSVARGLIGKKINWTTGLRIGAMVSYDIYVNKTIALSGQTWSNEIIQYTIPESNTTIEATINITCIIRNSNGWEAQKQINVTVDSPVTVMYDPITTNSFVEGSLEVMRWNISVHADATSVKYEIIANGTSILTTNSSLVDPILMVIFDLSSLQHNTYNLTCNYTVQVGSKLYNYSATSGGYFTVELSASIVNLNGTAIDPFVQNSTLNIAWKATLHADASEVKYQVIANGTIILFENDTVWDSANNIVYNLSNLTPGQYNLTVNITVKVGSNSFVYASIIVNVTVEHAVAIVLHDGPGAEMIRWTVQSIVWNTTVHINATVMKWQIMNNTGSGYTVITTNSTIWNPQTSITWDLSTLAHDFGYYRYYLNFTVTIEDFNITVISEEVVFSISNHAPTIDDPADITIFDSLDGVNVTWIPVDVDSNYAKYYISVTDNAGTTTIGTVKTWDGSNITYSLDNLGIGINVLMCFVNDTFGLSINSNVTVIVIKNLEPLIVSVSDFTVYTFDNNKSIRWTTSDPNDNYDYYEIYVNGVLNYTNTWTYSRISLSLDHFKEGRYNITIVVYDTLGLSDDEWAWVTVSSSLPTGYIQPDDTIAILVLAGCFVAVLMLVFYFTTIKLKKLEILPNKKVKSSFQKSIIEKKPIEKTEPKEPKKKKLKPPPKIKSSKQ